MGHEHEPETNRSGPWEFRVIGPRVVFGGSRHVLSDWGLGRDVVERYVTTPRDIDRNRDRSFKIQIGLKTGPNWYGPVFSGFLRLQDQSEPVMVQTGPKLVLDWSGLEKVYDIIHNEYKLNIFRNGC